MQGTIRRVGAKIRLSHDISSVPSIFGLPGVRGGNTARRESSLVFRQSMNGKLKKNIESPTIKKSNVHTQQTVAGLSPGYGTMNVNITSLNDYGSNLFDDPIIMTKRELKNLKRRKGMTKPPKSETEKEKIIQLRSKFTKDAVKSLEKHLHGGKEEINDSVNYYFIHDSLLIKRNDLFDVVYKQLWKHPLIVEAFSKPRITKRKLQELRDNWEIEIRDIEGTSREEEFEELNDENGSLIEKITKVFLTPFQVPVETSRELTDWIYMELPRLIATDMNSSMRLNNVSLNIIRDILLKVNSGRDRVFIVKDRQYNYLDFNYFKVLNAHLQLFTNLNYRDAFFPTRALISKDLMVDSQLYSLDDLNARQESMAMFTDKFSLYPADSKFPRRNCIFMTNDDDIKEEFIGVGKGVWDICNTESNIIMLLDPLHLQSEIHKL